MGAALVAAKVIHPETVRSCADASGFGRRPAAVRARECPAVAVLLYMLCSAAARAGRAARIKSPA